MDANVGITPNETIYESSPQPTPDRFNCVAVTRRGYMPGIVVGIDDEGLIQVQAPNSDRVYSFPEDAILTPEEGRRRMQNRRVQKVTHDYIFEELNEQPQAVRCYDPEHPRRSNYVLALGRAGWTCTCEAFHWRRPVCKHIAAWTELEQLDRTLEFRPTASREPHSAPGQIPLPLDRAA